MVVYFTDKKWRIQRILKDVVKKIQFMSEKILKKKLMGKVEEKNDRKKRTFLAKIIIGQREAKDHSIIHQSLALNKKLVHQFTERGIK